MVSECEGGGLSNLPAVVSPVSHRETTNVESVYERDVRMAKIIVRRTVRFGSCAEGAVLSSAEMELTRMVRVQK